MYIINPSFYISAQDLNFDQCNLVLNQDCDKNFHSTNLCKTHQIRISAIPNYVSDFHQVPGSIKIGMKFNNDTENHEFLHYIIENRPTSQCHIVGSSHVITFDEKKFQLLFQNSAWFILDQTLNHHEFFRIFVKFQFCGGEFVCPCAFFGMENSQWIYLNHCHQFSVMVEHSEKILLSSARSNMTFFVSTYVTKFTCP